MFNKRPPIIGRFFYGILFWMIMTRQRPVVMMVAVPVMVPLIGFLRIPCFMIQVNGNFISVKKSGDSRFFVVLVSQNGGFGGFLF